MKRIILLFLLFLPFFASADVTPNEAVVIAGEKLGEVARNTNVYAEILGKNMLKFQEFFMGIVKFVSLGFFNVGGDMAFIFFLFFALLFMMLYSVVGFVFHKFNFGIAFILTLLAFMGISEEALEALFLNYGAMGITITVVLPVLILLAFTFRIYQKAYEGKSKTSPFYAEMFNLVFMIFFGVFFIRHSYNEEGLISIMRYFSGWLLIGLGLLQTVFYKVFARLMHIQKVENRKFMESMRKMKQDFVDARNQIEIEAIDN